MQPIFRSAQSPKRTVAWLSCVFFALQALVPAGFMPAPLSSGQFVQLCPTGLTPELMRMLHPGHGGSSAATSLEPLGNSGHQMSHAGHHAGHQAHHSMAAAQIEPASHAEPSSHADQSDHGGAMSWRADCPFGAVAPADQALQLAFNHLVSAVPGASHSAKRPLAPIARNSRLSPPVRAPPHTSA